MERALLTDIRIQPYTLNHDYRSPEEWIDAVLAINAPLRQMLVGISDERLQEARGAAIEAATAYRQSDGHVRFPAYGYYAAASR